MQVTNEIRQAFLFAALNLAEQFTTETHSHGNNADCFQVQSGAWKFCKGHEKSVARKTNVSSVSGLIKVAFGATETEELMKWLTLNEKVAFGRHLLELTGGIDPSESLRTLTSDLTEDR